MFMKKSIKAATYISLVLVFLSASLLGMFGQDIAYYLHDKHGLLTPLKILDITTYSSYGLYLFFLTLVIIQRKRRIISDVLTKTCLAMLVYIGGMISLWSFFVLAMWHG
jgi:hypothetical protein